jgi:iron complex outermembrane receptor protein
LKRQTTIAQPLRPKKRKGSAKKVEAEPIHSSPAQTGAGGKQMTKQVLLLTCAVGAFSTLVGVGAASAAAPQSNTGQSATEVGAVIVTAEKRQQNLQKVPVAVTAFTSKQRDLVGIENLQDMTNFTPGLVYSSVLDRVTLRGVGRQTNLLSADAAVATYVDGFFTTSAVEASKDPMFVSNVEVLRGPQGTLQGRNAIAGALLVTTARPTATPYAEVRETIGNYNVSNTEFAISGPLADGLKARLQGFYDYQGQGYFKNVAGGPSEGNVLKEYYIEPSISAKLGDNADLYVKAFAAGWDNRGGPGARSNYTSGPWSNYLNDLQVPYNFNPTTAFNGGIIDPASSGDGASGMIVVPGSVHANNLNITNNPALSNYRNFATNTPLTVKLRDSYDVDAEFTYHFPGFDFKYVGGFQQYQYNLFLDADGTDVNSYQLSCTPTYGLGNPLGVPVGTPDACGFVGPLTVFPTINYSYEEDNQWYSHEINIASTGNGALQWLGGLYYYDEHYSNPIITTNPNQPQMVNPIYPFGGPAPTFAAAAPLNPNHYVSYDNYVMETRSEAVFGQLDWKATDTLKLTAGLRYTQDHKEGTEYNRVVLFGGDIVQGLPAPIPGFTPTPYNLYVNPYYNGAASAALDLTPSTIYGSPTACVPYPGVTRACSLNTTTGIVSRGLGGDFSATTGTAGLEWTPTSDILAYARYSRGYKSGGFNAGTIAPDPEVASEHVNSYEIGYKQTFGRNLVIDADLYYYDFQDAQYVVDVPGPIGPEAVLTSVPKSRVDGFELESIWTPLDHLQFDLSYSYNDTSVLTGCTATSATTGSGLCLEDTNDPGGLSPAARVVFHDPVTHAAIQAVNGNQLPNAPKNKFALNGNYTWVFDPGTLTFSASYIWRDQQYGALFKEAYDRAPSWSQVDMRLTWKGDNDHYEIILYGRNIFNTEGYEAAAVGGITGLTYPGTSYTQNNVYGVNPPATYGVELHYKFF